MSEVCQKRRLLYLSAHPADRYLYFDTILEKLGNLEGYEIVYTEAPNDQRCDLPQKADTLVILATEKYFTWQNSGYYSEYWPAKDRGIRVIPLLLESHVMNLLNMRCSKTQYIDATESFAFAVDTLCALLSNPVSRVVDESLPSVFVSYRKKDRKELRDLVGIIEKADNVRDFTLWYDEIISPGDNYSASIMKALEACDLFILLVTPSILEDGNYVLRKEYPTAKEMEKKIVAVEAVKTDRTLLQAKYPDLPKLISIKQHGALYARLKGIRDT